MLLFDRPFGKIFLLPLLVMVQTCSGSADDTKSGVVPGSESAGVQDVVYLRESRLKESSGLAISRRRPGYVWTHNDSGGKPRLYAFDANGRRGGQIDFQSIDANDWEDVAAYQEQGVSRLLIADCGDNGRSRSSVQLYLLDEPDPRDLTTFDGVNTIEVRYPDGARDCEAVAVDSQRRQIVLISKTFLPACGVYVIPLPSRLSMPRHMNVTAKRVGTLALPMVTAMDIDSSNGDLWVASYFQAFRFPAAQREMPIEEQVKLLPSAHEMPRWKQIEALAVGSNHDVWVTSEGNPAPLGRLDLRPESDPPIR